MKGFLKTHPYIVYLFSLFISTFSTQSLSQVVRYTEVKFEEIPNHKKLIGTLKAYQASNIANIEPGQITSVFVNEGDYVKKGQVLLEIDARILQTHLSQVKAELLISEAKHNASKIEYEQANRDYEAYKKSLKHSGVSKQTLEQSYTKARSAESNQMATKLALDVLRAQQERLQVRIENTRLKAPFNGQVITRLAELGQWLSAGSHAFTLSSADNLEAWIDVPQRYYNQINETKTSISLEVGNQLIHGKNLKIIDNVDNVSRTFQLVAQIESNNLLPGMSVNAWISQTDKVKSLLVPKDAIVQHDNRFTVFKLNQNQNEIIAEPVPISIKFFQNNLVAIESNQIKPGDQVVIEGNVRLIPGPVTAVNDSQSVLSNMN